MDKAWEATARVDFMGMSLKKCGGSKFNQHGYNLLKIKDHLVDGSRGSFLVLGCSE